MVIFVDAFFGLWAEDEYEFALPQFRIRVVLIFKSIRLFDKNRDGRSSSRVLPKMANEKLRSRLPAFGFVPWLQVEAKVTSVRTQ